MENKFIAESGDNKLIVFESSLKPSKVKTLLNKLNGHGFNLGSGHEEISVKKIDDDNYVFVGIPYYGAPSQRIDFERIP